MGNLSESPYWTVVFATVDHELSSIVIDSALSHGLKTEMYVLHNPVKDGASHGGGSRQCTSCEFMVVCYRKDPSGDNLDKNFAAIAENTRLKVCLK